MARRLDVEVSPSLAVLCGKSEHLFDLVDRQGCVTAVGETGVRGNPQLLGGLHGLWEPVAWPVYMPLLYCISCTFFTFIFMF